MSGRRQYMVKNEMKYQQHYIKSKLIQWNGQNGWKEAYRWNYFQCTYSNRTYYYNQRSVSKYQYHGLFLALAMSLELSDISVAVF